jgi:hypothetical protein
MLDAESLAEQAAGIAALDRRKNIALSLAQANGKADEGAKEAQRRAAQLMDAQIDAVRGDLSSKNDRMRASLAARLRERQDALAALERDGGVDPRGLENLIDETMSELSALKKEAFTKEALAADAQEELRKDNLLQQAQAIQAGDDETLAQLRDTASRTLASLDTSRAALDDEQMRRRAAMQARLDARKHHREQITKTEEASQGEESKTAPGPTAAQVQEPVLAASAEADVREAWSDAAAAENKLAAVNLATRQQEQIAAAAQKGATEKEIQALERRAEEESAALSRDLESHVSQRKLELEKRLKLRKEQREANVERLAALKKRSEAQANARTQGNLSAGEVAAVREQEAATAREVALVKAQASAILEEEEQEIVAGLAAVENAAAAQQQAEAAQRQQLVWDQVDAMRSGDEELVQGAMARQEGMMSVLKTGLDHERTHAADALHARMAARRARLETAAVAAAAATAQASGQQAVQPGSVEADAAVAAAAAAAVAAKAAQEQAAQEMDAEIMRLAAEADQAAQRHALDEEAKRQQQVLDEAEAIASGDKERLKKSQESFEKDMDSLKLDMKHQRERTVDGLQHRLDRRRKAKLAAEEANAAQRSKALATAQGKEQNTVQDKVDDTSAEWEAELAATLEQKKREAEAKGQAEVDALEREQALIRQELRKKQEREQAAMEATANAERTRALAELSQKLEAEKQSLMAGKEKELQASLQNATADEAKRIQEEFRGEADRAAQGRAEEQQKKKSQLAKRLAAKKAKKALELQRRHQSEMTVEVQAQNDDKSAAESKQVKAAEAAAIEALVKSSDGETLPEAQLGKAIEMAMEGRHAAETEDLMSRQFGERSTAIQHALEQCLEDKATERTAILATAADADAVKDKIDDLEQAFKRKMKTAKEQAVAGVEPKHAEETLALRQKQFLEVRQQFKQLAPEDVIRNQMAEQAAAAEAEMEAFKAEMEHERAERVEKLRIAKKEYEAKLRADADAELKELEEEHAQQVERDNKEHARAMDEKRQRLVADKARLEEKASAADGEINEERRAQLMKSVDADMAKLSGEMNEKRDRDRKRLEARLLKKRMARKQASTRRINIEVEEKEMEAAKEISRADESVAKIISERANMSKVVWAAAMDGVGAGAGSGGLAARFVKKAALKWKSNVRKGRERRAAERQAKRLRSKLTEASGESKDDSSGPTSAAQSVANAADVESRTISASREKAIYSKIADIEGMLAKIFTAIETGSAQMPGSGGSPNAAVDAPIYVDRRDATLACEGRLEIKSEASLNAREAMRFRFAQRALELMDMGPGSSDPANQVTIVPATALPANDNTHNAFRNSFHWDPTTRSLYVRVERMENVGEFVMVLMHSLAHIKVNPKDVSNDNDPEFRETFFHAMRGCTQSLFQHPQELDVLDGPRGNGGSGGPAAATMSRQIKKRTSIDHAALAARSVLAGQTPTFGDSPIGATSATSPGGGGGSKGLINRITHYESFRRNPKLTKYLSSLDSVDSGLGSLTEVDAMADGHVSEPSTGTPRKMVSIDEHAASKSLESNLRMNMKLLDERIEASNKELATALEAGDEAEVSEVQDTLTMLQRARAEKESQLEAMKNKTGSERDLWAASAAEERIKNIRSKLSGF